MPEQITPAQAWIVVHQTVRAEIAQAAIFTDGALIDHQRIAWQTVADLVELYVTDPQFAGFADGQVLERKSEKAQRTAARRVALSLLNRRSATAQIGREL